jgi:NDP-mannose synthase
LGTCGPLSLLRKELTEPFLVMNGDLLTTANFYQLYQFALNTKTDFVVATKELIYPFEFGNVTCEGDFIREVKEKPNLKIEIIAGIYIMKPPILELIPDGEYFGMDHLLIKALSNKIPVARYLLKDYWIDIGRIEDYEKAEEVYNTHFKGDDCSAIHNMERQS